ncbi:GGDEF domain-containing protein [Candidatus Omnitrophota bacterium]
MIQITKDKDRFFLIICAVVITAVIGYLDYVSGYRLSFSIFYLLPIMVITWRLTRNMGIIMALFNTAIWVIADLFARDFRRNPYILTWNALVRFGFFLIIILAMSKLKTLLEKEKSLARKDYVTDIPNNHAFFERVDLELHRSRRYKRPLTLAYIDCDNFKSINDTLGHPTGDAVLRAIAQNIQRSIRVTDMVARIGGDEFVVLLSETGEESVEPVLSRLRKNFLEEIEAKKWPITLSIGVATFITPPESVVKMIKQADELMYLAKKSGKNMIHRTIYKDDVLRKTDSEDKDE